MAQKVLILATNLRIGGAQKMIEQLVLNIDKDKYTVKLIVLSKRLGTFLEKNIDQGRIDVLYLNKDVGFNPRYFKKVAEEIKAFSPDIIHTHMNSWLYAVPSVVKRVAPMLHTIHSSPERQEAYSALRLIITYLYKTKRAIPVAISDKIKIEAEKTYKLSSEQIETVYNPVDYQKFAANKKLLHHGFIFVNVARFNSIKNHLFLIEAFEKVHENKADVYLYLAGEGEELEVCRDYVESHELSDSVIFLGAVEDIPKVLAKSDVFVLPSKSEGIPLSLLEAEAAGMPVIASNVGGVPDIVDTNGILFDVNNQEELINAMHQMINNDDLRDKMSARSQEIARQYSSEVITREYESLYEKYGRQDDV